MEKSNSIWKVIIGFFCVILFFTIFSRVVHHAGTATVTLTTPTSGTVGHVATGSGTVCADNQTAVTVEEGLLVEQVCCSEGETVASGQELLRIEADSLQEKIDEYSDAIKVLELQNQELDSQRQTEVSQAQKSYNSAKEAYEDTVTEQQENVDSAKAALDEKMQELETFQTAYGNGVYATDGGQSEATGNLTSAGSQSDSNGSQASAGGQSGLSNDTSYEETLAELEAAVTEAQETYSAALEAQSDAVAAAESALEDSEVSIADSTQTEQNDISIAQYQEKLDRLKAYQDAGGIVYAEADGYVQQVFLTAGESTTGGTVMLIANAAEELSVTAEFDSAEEEYLYAGDSVTVTPDGADAGDALTELTIASVSTSADNPDVLTVTVDLPLDSLAVGSAVSLEVSSGSESYENCLDKSTLHESGDGSYYVYVVDEENTVLGKETVAKRVTVELLNANDTTVAVEGVFEGQDVVLESSKELTDGNPVNVQE